MYKINKKFRRKIKNSTKGSFLLLILFLLLSCSEQKIETINKIYSLEDVVGVGYKVKGDFKIEFPEATIVKWGFYKGREIAVIGYPTIELANTLGKTAGEEQTEKIEIVEKNIGHGSKVEKLKCRGGGRFDGGWTGKAGIKLGVRWNSEDGLGSTFIINKSRFFENEIDVPHAPCYRREPLYTEFIIHGNLILMVEPLTDQDPKHTLEFLAELIKAMP